MPEFSPDIPFASACQISYVCGVVAVDDRARFALVDPETIGI
jgi:hypothetical protein